MENFISSYKEGKRDIVRRKRCSARFNKLKQKAISKMKGILAEAGIPYEIDEHGNAIVYHIHFH